MDSLKLYVTEVFESKPTIHNIPITDECLFTKARAVLFEHHDPFLVNYVELSFVSPNGDETVWLTDELLA